MPCPVFALSPLCIQCVPESLTGPPHALLILDKLTTHEIQQFYAGLKQNGRLLWVELYGEGLSGQTVRGIHTPLHAALDKAVSERLTFRNPADGCFELLLLELSTGLRRGEICALQWNDLNFRTGELQVERQVYRARGKLV